MVTFWLAFWLALCLYFAVYCRILPDAIGKIKSHENPHFTRLLVTFGMVGVTGLEPMASWSRTKRSTKLSYTPKWWKPPHYITEAFTLAAELGFEPRQTESESAVLPLHNSASDSDIYYTHIPPVCQPLFLIFLRIVPSFTPLLLLSPKVSFMT